MAIKKFNTTDEYVEDLNSKLPKIKIIKSEITNLDSLDKPLGEQYEIEMSLFDKLNDRIAFNPFLLDKRNTNPFKLAERTFPVDWGMASDDRFILTMHLPPQYTVETPPRKMSISLPDNGGRFLTDYQGDNNTFYLFACYPIQQVRLQFRRVPLP